MVTNSAWLQVRGATDTGVRAVSARDARLIVAVPERYDVAPVSPLGRRPTPAQSSSFAEAAVRWSPPGKTVMVHVGAHRVEEACELARHAAGAGAHAVSSLPPLSYPFEDIRRYSELSSNSREASETIVAAEVPTSLTVPASTASGRSVQSRITRTGFPREGASS